MSSAPALTESEHLSAALVDIAGKRICDRLQNRYRGLKRDLPGGATAYSGTLWIHSCEVEYNEKQQDIITLLLGIEGWRWLYREKEKLGAEFKVSEFAQFQVDISLQGRVAAKYDPQAKRLAMWLKPTETPEVNFKASGDVDVEKEGMWGAVLAGAASLIGQSPDTLADETDVLQ
ncbi:hypothetical protein CA267_018665 [Alteromonas pelagimontana]|uniref:Uncharacterized protein n=1 Tax=Alteromonas pelagimontana TaxID=1858656 RepID=A0A6M4MJ59_9ALTE|nr:hypothetical protein [Alteromonas pelagimontana]QJR82630.1 hypothetical protein CA267_018665 [Alteromonas pelagimontana]